MFGRVAGIVDSAVEFLVKTNEYQPGAFDRKMVELSLDGTTMIWIEPWFFLGAIFDAWEIKESYHKKLASHIEKKKDQYFHKRGEPEMDAKKRDPIEYQFKMYEIILKGVFESLHNFGEFSPEDDHLVDIMLHKLYDSLIKHRKDQAA